MSMMNLFSIVLTYHSQVCSEARFRVDCERFLGRLGGLCAMSCKASNDPIRTRNIRVAFLDSGVDKEDGMVGAAIKSKIISCKSRSFVQGDAEDGWQHDADGHGTHVARLLRHYAPTAEIFVGKICVGSKVSGKEYDGVAKVRDYITYQRRTNLALIWTQAIEWAAKDCDADIISLSLGSEDDHSGIRHAIDRASQHYRKLIIASASNDGGRSGRSQPASLPGVICMHATDGDGNCGGINPSPIIGTDNFATLGIAIYSQWKEKNVLLSGTSYAVPVAVGFAVCVLEFAKHVCNIDAEDLARLTRTDAMSRVFKKMSSRRDGYDFLWPRHLWPNFKTNPKLDKESVSEEIMTILKSL
ncbi:peptidase S8/S53 domain-containing protein [Stachybotrys elegans]|uniref:Peptidase S8/S53 domain-containing protein n=1 Tax=Stachybotrys elegans TaxID=80388 RepID=A0A8K0SKA7_9HYPO|nr:peptidase S8/S53 domain-containing protein [Stachybotrys elegans]